MGVESVRDELLRAPVDCNLVRENSARAMLGNTFDENIIIAEWEKLCPQNADLRILKLSQKLSSMENFDPDLNFEVYHKLKPTRLNKIAYNKDSDFNKLCRSNAEKQTPISEDGKILLTYFLHGPESFLSDSHNAKEGFFYKQVITETENRANQLRVTLFTGGGLWAPAGNLSALGNHPSAHFAIGLSLYGFSAAFKTEIRFAETPNSYTFYNTNTGVLERTNFFAAFYIGGDFSWEITRIKFVRPMLLAGFGYDGITHMARPDRQSRAHEVISDSFNYNAGIGTRIMLDKEQMFFAQIEARYNRANYKGEGAGATDLSGNYMTYTLSFGAFISML